MKHMPIQRLLNASSLYNSLSLSSPSTKVISTQLCEGTLDQIEKKLAPGGQPRVVLFHKEEGRHHAHYVWSRVDTEEMKAVNMPLSRIRLLSIRASAAVRCPETGGVQSIYGERLSIIPLVAAR